MQANGYGGTNIVGVMITNNATGHSPETHARATAAKVVIDPFPQDDPTGEKLEAAQSLRMMAEQVFVHYHRGVECGRMTDHYAAGALDNFLTLTKGTVLESHYANPLVQDLIRFELAHEFGSQFQFISANQK